MKETKDVVACVVDKGQFSTVAQALAKGMKRVYYYSPSDKACEVISEGVLGDGLPGVIKVRNFWTIKHECDLFVFPDAGFEGEQLELVNQGFPVWGSRFGSILEKDRGKFIRTLDAIGLEVPHYEVITGIDNLRVFLRDEEDKFIKISRWRGDMETFKWRSYRVDDIELDRLAVRFGPLKNRIKFYVFDKIDTDIEDGLDTYVIDGKMPNIVLHGYENKDKSFVGMMTDYPKLPEQLREVAEAFTPELAKYGYRGAFSEEVRITKEANYFIDPTCRFPSPPHQLQMRMFGNFPDIVWLGANGECIDPEKTALYGVQAVIKGERDNDEWACVEIPDSIADHISCSFVCHPDNLWVFPPGGLGNMLGWLTATDDTLEGAIKKLQSYKKELPSGLECEDISLAELLTNIQAGENKGVPFTKDEIPSPEIVLAEK